MAGTWGDGVDADLLLNDTGFPDIWYGPTAFLVSMQTFTRVADSTSAPQVNVDIDGSPVFTEDSGNGPAVGAAFSETSIVGVDVATYQIDTNNTIELPCTVAGGTGDAEDLTVIAEVVVP